VMATIAATAARRTARDIPLLSLCAPRPGAR